MIGKLAFNNIKKAYNIYFVYAFTLMLTIALFYGFSALGSSPAMMTLKKEDAQYVSVFLALMNTTAYFVSFFVIFLMVYASEFFFKVRSNEYFVYKTLGMNRKNLSKLIFFENLIVGVFSAVLGIVVGIILNQLLGKLLIDYIGLTSTFSLAISFSSIVKTLIYFTILLIIISTISSFRISKVSIIELKHVTKQINKKKVNLIVSSIQFSVGALFLIVAYFFAYESNLNPTAPTFYLAILIGFLGTILSYFGIINFKNTRFRSKTHSQSTLKNSLFYNKLMKNKLSISMVSISIMFILTAIFGANALIGIFEQDIQVPTDADIYVTGLEEYDFKDIDLKKYGLEKNTATYTEQYFSTSCLNGNEICGFPIIKRSEFEQIQKVTDSKQDGTENPIEYYNGGDTPIYDNAGDLTGETYSNSLGLKNLKVPSGFKVTKNDSGIAEKTFRYGVLVVKDSKYDELKKLNEEQMDPSEYNVQKMLIKYNSKSDEKKAKQIRNDIIDAKGGKGTNVYVNLTTKQELFKTVLVFKVSILFVTIYIAFFLVIISLAILAIQQVMDAIDNKQEYKKLQTLGLSTKDIKKITNKNINRYFSYPLYLAVISTMAAIVCIDKFVSSVSTNHIINKEYGKNTIILIIILVIIYIIYIKLVKNIYNRIVEEQ